MNSFNINEWVQNVLKKSSPSAGQTDDYDKFDNIGEILNGRDSGKIWEGMPAFISWINCLISV